MEIQEHILVMLSRRYPQLLLPLSYDTKDSLQYKDAVLRGRWSEAIPEFTFSESDSLTFCETPAGRAEILYLHEREDFVHCLQALAYRCEPRRVPASVGANTIRGLINWEKIYRHKTEYENAGGRSWNLEFRRFTADSSNYRDTLILLSRGRYSATPPEMAGLSEEEWLDKSLTIRKYHELTHFVCRSLYPDEIDALRDEVFADMIGLLAAFGMYDTGLARVFLGIEGSRYRSGGRLEHYLTDDEIDPEEARASALVDLCGSVSKGFQGDVIAQIPSLFEKIKKI